MIASSKMKGLDLLSVPRPNAVRKSCHSQRRKISREFPFICVNEIGKQLLAVEWNAAICAQQQQAEADADTTICLSDSPSDLATPDSGMTD
jgi:hypothetical protein